MKNKTLIPQGSNVGAPLLVWESNFQKTSAIEYKQVYRNKKNH